MTVSMESIDKLFLCMAEFYGERWTSQFKDEHALTFAKSMWQSALTGLSHNEIKETLIYYRWMASKFPHEKPPHQLEFYRAATQHKVYVAPKEERGDVSVARAHLTLIRNK